MSAAAASDPGTEAERWPVWGVQVALLAWGVLVLAASPLVQTLARLLGVHVTGADHPVGVGIATTADDELCAGLVAILMVCCFSSRARAQALRRSMRPASWPAAAVAIAAVLMCVDVSGGVISAVFGASNLHGDYTRVGPFASLPFIVDVLVVIGLTPVCEEFLFRGYLFTTLRRRLGPLPAALIAGTGFGLLHVPVYHVLGCVPLAVLGIGLCLIYWQTGSLIPCMVAHALNNAAGYAADAHLLLWQRGTLIAAALGCVLATIRLLERSQTIRLLATTRPDATIYTAPA
jgi:membrane protease YdiL (CAAX protease family)